jgi:hypothetical protein
VPVLTVGQVSMCAMLPDRYDAVVFNLSVKQNHLGEFVKTQMVGLCPQSVSFS